MRIKTLHSGNLLRSTGTIRGGSFPSAMILGARLRHWIATASALPLSA
ncbi:MAG: hypothetical protein IPM61_00310 [Chlorobi bacterium]|nr:hypothetical protein [Chlorobiota bacterium]